MEFARKKKSRKKIIIGAALLVCVLLVVIALAHITASQHAKKNNKTVEFAQRLCSGINGIPTSECISGMSYALTYVHTHFPNAKIVGRRIGYTLDENSWFFGVYILENNIRYSVVYLPTTGKIVTSHG